VTGLRGRVSIIGGALIIVTGLAIPDAATTASSAATTATQGIDVSSVQHPGNAGIDWSAAAPGNAFAAIKASEGNYYSNPYFAGDATHESDAQKASSFGLYIMPYAFANPFKPSVNGTAAQQADRAAGVINSAAVPAGLLLPLALDIEPDPYQAAENTNECYGYTQPAMVTWIQQFLAEAKKDTGKTPLIYTTADFWQKCTGNSTTFGTNGYPLWLASYDVSNPALPAGWNNYTFWQYTPNGTVNGIKGSATDLDYLGPVLQVSPAGKAIAPVQLQTLTSLNGQPVSYTPGTLPPGLSVSSSGQITGTPTTIGKYSVTVTPSAGAVPSSIAFTWDVHGTITMPSLGTRLGTAGTPVALRVTASDPDTGYTPSFAAAGLPTGLTMSPSGLITGWPSKPGTFKITVTASDGLGGTGTMSFTWTIRAAADSGFTGVIKQAGGTAKCLNDPASVTANGTHVILWSCTGHANQNWTIVKDGTIRVLGKCLDVVGEGKANGTKLQIWTCNSADGGQLWQAGTDGQLVNPQSGKCLDVPVSTAANGTQPVLWTCANVTTQPSEHWLRPGANVYSGTGRCLAASGSTAVAATCANTAAQHWTAQPDGTIRVGGRCLTEAGTTARSVLVIGSCSGAAATKWTLLAAGPIATELAGAAAGLCASVPPSGATLVLEACAPAPATTWHVE
jgi:GH25 family lysozyme M1 (1,4-beta-N-acetylmuramidase)